jgi:hypothetical protein
MCGVIIPEGRQVCPNCAVTRERNKRTTRQLRDFMKDIKKGEYDICQSEKLSQKTTN